MNHRTDSFDQRVVGNDGADRVYVGDDTVMRTGAEAARLLAAGSDSPFLTERDGVTRVPRERWEVAQRYEATTWMSAGAHAVEDRNSWHLDNFDGYGVLKGRRFAHAIELGCGPFTNLRAIAEVCSIERCSLLDPLIERYLSHRHCSYGGGYLRSREKRLSRALERTVAHRALRRAIRRLAPRWLSDGVPVVAAIASPIEEFVPTCRYDLVVMINVIEHCYDMHRIFDVILRSLADGGTFVFSDKAFDHAHVASVLPRYYDAGHPLRVDARVLDDFRKRHFECLFEASLPAREVVSGETALEYRELYFIGRKLGPGTSHAYAPAP